MRPALLLVGGIVIAALTDTGHARDLRQTAILRFDQPTWVTTELLIGTYLIEHDEARMASGDPCTVVYRSGAHRVEVVAFHCIPRARSVARTFSTTVLRDPLDGTRTLLEYQFAGDSEAHGVPIVRLAEENRMTPCPHPDAVASVADPGDLHE